MKKARNDANVSRDYMPLPIFIVGNIYINIDR